MEMEKAGDGQICALPARLSYNNKFSEMLFLKGTVAAKSQNASNKQPCNICV